MNLFLKGVARAVTESFDLPEPIVEIGSYLVPGQSDLAELRSLFPGKEYLGVDMRDGPGVDLVGDVEDLPLEDASVGTVISMNTFEHVPRFWRGFEEIFRVLRPDGVFFLSVPFNCPIHSYPSDYWRFTPESLEILLDKYPQRIVGWHGPEERPQNIWSLACREGCPQISPQQYDKYETLIRRYARQPIRWKRKLRYRFIDWLDRRRLCAPFLEVENWKSALKKDCVKTTAGIHASASTDSGVTPKVHETA